MPVKNNARKGMTAAVNRQLNRMMEKDKLR